MGMKLQIGTIRSRQRKCMDHIMRRDSLLRTIMEGRMEAEETTGRLRKMPLDWMTRIASSQSEERDKQ